MSTLAPTAAAPPFTWPPARRDNLSSIECEIETIIRSQEQARSKAQKHRMQLASKLHDRRRDMITETLYRDVSRYGRLITDIIQIVDDSSCATEVWPTQSAEKD